MGSDVAIRVLLFRTGHTQWETSGRLGGSSDVPLAPEGRAHVERCLKELGPVQLGVVYCGPDEASVATASALAEAAGARVKVVDDLAEMHLGLWEGLSESELEGKCPTAYRQWMEDPSGVSAPEGEQVEDVQARVVGCACRLLEKSRGSGGAVAFVLRPVALAVLGCALDGQPYREMWPRARNGFLPEWRTLGRGEVREVRELAEGSIRR